MKKRLKMHYEGGNDGRNTHFLALGEVVVVCDGVRGGA